MDIIYFDIKSTEFSIKNKYTLSEKKYLLSQEREIETILSLGNGYIGTRNSLEESYPQSTPATFVAGFYEKGIDEEFDILIRFPDWTRIKIFIDEEQLDLVHCNTLHHSRYIDRKIGCAVREWRCSDKIGRINTIKIIKFISAHNKHELGKSLLIKPENYTGNIRVLSGIDCNTADFNYLINQNVSFKNQAAVLMKSKFNNKEFMMVQKSLFLCTDKTAISLPYQSFHNAQAEYQTINNFSGSFEEWSWRAEMGKIYNINSITTIYDNMDTPNLKEATDKHFSDLGQDFFDISAKNHIIKWIFRWRESSLKIIGNDLDQKYVDFALYHLICSAEFSGIKSSVPARDLSGEAYKGHIFWDTEMFLLPFFIYTKPEIARNLLLYRYNTLEGAKMQAQKSGFKGASYAWESTDSGLEMTPNYAIFPDGTFVNVLSGDYENHISADIAYSIWKYWQATRDKDFLVNYGAEILFETARYYESLIKLEPDGLYHIPTVIGPDEYHEKVDDNAYTNYLANYNFEIAIKAYEFLKENFSKELSKLVEKINLKTYEIDNWRKYKENFYFGFDEKTGLYEQFKGFYDLEYINLKQYEPRSVPMDIILGKDRTNKTQVIKQADVLMFLYLFGENFSKKELLANFEYYEPRSGHGSSLSPSIHSIIAARLGKTEQAYKYFIQNAEIDLNNEFGNSAGGLHIASLGGIWLSIINGFAGMYTTDKGLIFEPHLPEVWNSIEFSIKWRNQDLNIKLDKEKIIFSLSGNQNICVSLGQNNWKELEKNKRYIGIQTYGDWNWKD